MQKNTIVAAGAAAVVAVSVAVGGAALASAQTPALSGSPSATATSSPGSPGTEGTEGKEGKEGTHAGRRARIQARLLSGDTAVKVTQAATSKEPTAKLEVVATDPAGGYLARMARTDGTQIIVRIDASFTVTKVENAPLRPHRERGERGPKPSPTSTTAPSGTATG